VKAGLLTLLGSNNLEDKPKVFFSHNSSSESAITRIISVTKNIVLKNKKTKKKQTSES
jgi:hypothetical protein